MQGKDIPEGGQHLFPAEAIQLKDETVTPGGIEQKQGRQDAAVRGQAPDQPLESDGGMVAGGQDLLELDRDPFGGDDLFELRQGKGRPLASGQCDSLSEQYSAIAPASVRPRSQPDDLRRFFAF